MPFVLMMIYSYIKMIFKKITLTSVIVPLQITFLIDYYSNYLAQR